MCRQIICRCFAMFVFVLVGQAAAADAPETLKFGDLANHPERWPAQVKVLKTLRFGPGLSLQAGQSVRLMDIQGQDVIVDVGKNNLVAVGPNECDLVAAANRAWSALTLAQRAVDSAALMNDASLWPDKVTCLVTFDLTNGKSLAPGQEFTLSWIDRQGITLFCNDPEAHLTAKVIETDIFPRARERASVDPAMRKSRVVKALRGILVDAAGKSFDKKNFEDAKVFVLYHGANWCQPCHQFSPTLVKFANDAAPANPHLFVAMLDGDDEESAMLKYANEAKMPWPLISKANGEKQLYLKGLFGNYIPQIVVLDHFGKLLASSDMNGKFDNVTPMRTLAALIKSGAAK